MKTRLLLTLVFGLFLVTASAQAIPYLDFNLDAMHPTGASISFAGGANPLIGVNLSVDSVLGIDTPLNDFVQLNLHSAAAPNGAILNFTTGNFTGSGVDEWLFGGGGSITLDLPGYGNLFTGAFTFAEVDVSPTNGFKIVISSFVDTKDPLLLALYGLPTGIPYSGNTNISFIATAVTPNAFTSSRVLSGDVTNTPTPEPISLILLGSGLVGAGVWRRLRKS